MRAGKLTDPKGQDERDGAVQIPGISVLDELLELALQGRRDLDRGGGCFHRLTYEGPDRIGARPEFVVRSEPFEVRLFLGGEAHTEEMGRRSYGSSGSHSV